MNTAIYLRKSRSDPDDESIDETLSRHKKTLLEFAKINNLIITDVYEEVVSGDGLFVRPQMIRLLNDIESNKFDGVLCMDIDRLGRVDTKDRGIILDAFKSNNTKIITPKKIYDLNDEIDEFSTEIQMLMARQELKKITQRMQAGIKRTVKDGYHIAEPPYGYRRVYINKRPSLEIYEEEANIIRTIFDMYVNQHLGSSTIADYINSLGFRTRKNTPFSRNTIRFFLQNETYIGKIIYNKRRHIKKKLPTDKHKAVLNPQEEWIISDGAHPAIVDENIFNKAQEIRKTRSHPPSFDGSIKNPLAGIIHCKNCGSIMTRQTSKKTSPRLICNTVGCCQSTTIDKVEKIILSSLKKTAAEWRTLLQSNTRPNINAEEHELTERIFAAKKQLTTLKMQNETLHDLLEQGVYTIDVFLERSNILKDKISATEQQINEYQARLRTINNKPTLQTLLPIMEHLIKNYDEISPSEKNRLFKKLIRNITYSRVKELKSKSPIILEIYYHEWI